MTNYTEMLTHAHAIKKPTKKEAWEILHAIAWGGDTLARNGDNIAEDRLIKLMAHFLPAVPKVPKSDRQWVASAIDAKDPRGFIHFLYVDAGTMYGTDGHRLHWAPTARPNGYYSPATGEAVADHTLKFPNVERVIPARQAGIELGMPDLIVVDKDSEGRTLAQLPHGGHVNLAYLQAATLGKPATFHLRGPNDSIRLEMAGDRGAVIMPVRV